MKRIFIFLLAFIALYPSAAVAGERPRRRGPGRRLFELFCPFLVFDEGQPRERGLVFYDEQRSAREVAAQALAGKQVMVRIYNNWQKEPKAFELVAVEPNQLAIQYEVVKAAFPRTTETAIVVVKAEDQKDPNVAEFLGDCIYYNVHFKESRALDIWSNRFTRNVSEWWTFRDAAGEPVPNAEVDLYICATEPEKSNRVFIGKVRLDEKSRIKPIRFFPPDFNYCYFFVFSHPEYGPNPAETMPCQIGVIRYRECFRIRALSKDRWCVFKDALGNPIPEATVEILGGDRVQLDMSRSIGKFKLDEKGRLEPTESNMKLRGVTFILSHPDYGTAMASYQVYGRDRPLEACIIPLVPMGTEADERSIWGTIVDAEGKPICGAVIMCNGVATPAGGYISPYREKGAGWYRTMSDEQGRFTMCLPLGADGRLVPPGSKYTVHIDLRKAFGSHRHEERINSGEETTIIIPSAGQGGRFHTFAFEDANGPITDPNLLKEIRISISGKNYSKELKYDQWKDGGTFPFGTYGMHIGSRALLEFEQIKVTEESPEELVFKVKPDITYYGQVVNGITGEPMPEVVVMMGAFSADERMDSSIFGPEQWQALRAAAAEPDKAENYLTKLKYRRLQIDKITMTDRQGWYEFAFINGKDESFFHFVALEKDYLVGAQLRHFRRSSDGGKTRLILVEPDENGNVQVSEIKLYPAATLTFEPNFPVKSGEDELHLRWRVNSDDRPAWVDDFLYLYRHSTVLYHKGLRPANQIHTSYVPADVEMEIRVSSKSDSRCCPFILGGIKLEQGQVLDLGRIDFQPAVRVCVKVVDPSGEPVEGMTVEQCKGSSLGRQEPITDKEGIVFLYVWPYSEGQFCVHYLDRTSRVYLTERTSYEIAGEEDADRQFILQLSDEIIQHLFK